MPPSCRAPLRDARPSPIDAVQEHVDEAPRDRFGPIGQGVLEDRGARHAEQERGREVPLRLRPARADGGSGRPRPRAGPDAVGTLRAGRPVLVALDHRQQVLPLPEEAQDRQDDQPEGDLAGRRARGCVDLDRRWARGCLERRTVQVVLRREVEVDGALPHPRPLGDVAHLDLMEVALGEHRRGRRQWTLSLVVACHMAGQSVLRTDRSVLVQLRRDVERARLILQERRRQLRGEPHGACEGTPARQDDRGLGAERPGNRAENQGAERRRTGISHFNLFRSADHRWIRQLPASVQGRRWTR